MAAKRKTADPAPLVGAGLGRVAYEAFDAGDKAPAWDALDHDTAANWCAAAQAVIAATFERNPA